MSKQIEYQIKHEDIPPQFLLETNNILDAKQAQDTILGSRNITDIYLILMSKILIYSYVYIIKVEDLFNKLSVKGNYTYVVCNVFAVN